MCFGMVFARKKQTITLGFFTINNENIPKHHPVPCHPQWLSSMPLIWALKTNDEYTRFITTSPEQSRWPAFGGYFPTEHTGVCLGAT